MKIVSVPSKTNSHQMDANPSSPSHSCSSHPSYIAHPMNNNQNNSDLGIVNLEIE